MSREELGILRAVAEALNSSPDVRQALERTLSLVADLLGLRTGWVWLVDQETGRFYDAVERELPPYLQERVRMAGSRNCWCLEDFRDGQLTPTNIDIMECSRLQPAFRGKSASAAAGLRYHASIPLYFQDKRLGIMNVTGPAWRKLTADELRLLSTIAYQVGIAIERARLAEDATRLARAEERARIAREIHDTLAQGLTAIALNIEGAMHRIEKQRPDEARVRLERALAMAAKTWRRRGDRCWTCGPRPWRVDRWPRHWRLWRGRSRRRQGLPCACRRIRRCTCHCAWKPSCTESPRRR